MFNVTSNRRRLIALLFTLLGVSLFGAVLIVTHERPATSAKIYTVTQIVLGLSINPRGWAGRTVSVRGRFETMGDATTHWYILSQNSSPRVPISDDNTLMVAPAESDALLAALRRVPGISTLLPEPQVPHYPTTGVYLIRLQEPRECNPSALSPQCIVGMIMSATPGNL